MIVREPVGKQFTDGFEVLDLGGEEPAVIRAVASVGGDGVIEQLGALLAGPDRKYAAEQLLTGYPPRQPRLGALQDAVGATIQPRDDTRDRLGYELLVGYRSTSDEIGIRTEIVVDYEVDGVLYRRRFPATLVYCPPRLAEQECSDAADDAISATAG
jgi:hypothetical protein